MIHQCKGINVIESGWLKGAEHLPSPNFNERPSGSVVDLLVIHNISLPPSQYGGGFVQDFFLNKLDTTHHPFFESIAEMKVSAHLFIERGGELTQFVSFDDRAWHAGRSSFDGRDECNDYGIGIELEGVDNAPYTQAQYNCLVDVSARLMDAYPAITLERIVGHNDIAPERKTDPGPAFDWSLYRKLLTEYRLNKVM